MSTTGSFVVATPDADPTAAVRPYAPAGRRPRGAAWRRRAAPYLYLTPATAVVVTWVYRPVLQLFRLSFVKWNLLPTSPRRYVGTANYRRVLNSPDLRHAAWNTLLYTAGLLLLIVVLPTIIALIGGAEPSRSHRFYAALMFVPVLVPPVAIAALWQWLLDPHGVVNRLIGTIGLPQPNWLRQSGTALPAVTFITAWQYIGLAVLILSAGMAGISGEYLDAAKVDGASARQTTWWVRLPLLTPSIMLLVMASVLLCGTWTFPIIDSLTQGGPVGASTNLYYFLWQSAFGSFNVGAAAAAGVLLWLGFVIVAVFLLRLTDRASKFQQ